MSKTFDELQIGLIETADIERRIAAAGQSS